MIIYDAERRNDPEMAQHAGKAVQESEV